MINISVEKYCENCIDFEVEQNTNCATTFDGRTAFVQHTIMCKNRKKCRRICNYLKQYKINEIDNEEI